MKWLTSERFCFNNNNRNRENIFSFAQSSGKLIKFIETKYRDYDVETHLNESKDQLNVTFHRLGRYSCQITSGCSTGSSLRASSHLHWMLSSSPVARPGPSAACSEAAVPPEAVGLQFHPL